jgi:dihydrofolate reductase
MQRKLILYIACSLDGYIAAPGDDLSFLEAVAQDGEDYGYSAFVETVDTIIMGRKTYDWILKHAPFPHTDKRVFIVTHTPRASEGNITFYTGSLRTLLEDLKSHTGQHIFCDGGADVVHALLKDNLIDECIISVIPVLLGNGTRLFKDGRDTKKLSLVLAKSFPSGLVQLHYKCI